MKKFFSFLVFASAMFLVYGCKKSPPPVPAESSMSVPAAENVVTDYVPAQGEYKTVARCPVSGDKVTVGKNTIASKYKGKTYYFCCPACAPQFKAAPEKYAK